MTPNARSPLDRATATDESGPAERTGRDPLATRITKLSVSAAAMALLVAGLLLNATLFWFDRSTLIENAQAYAGVVAANASAAMTFGDHAAAQETLQSLTGVRGVARATLHGDDGTVFADFLRGGDASSGPAPAAAGLHVGLLDIVVVVPVQGRVAQTGWLRIEVPMAPLYRRAAAFAGVTAAATGLALLLTWAFAVGVRRDLVRVERRMDDLARRDPVTGLFNRHAAREHMAEAERKALTTSSGFSIVSIDLDNFKTINDTLGHHVGDAVLREVAARLLQTLQPGANAYRFGGDEFVLISPWPEGLRRPHHYAKLVHSVIDGLLHVDGYEIALGASIGVARFPNDGDTAEEVLMASDIAMYKAKTGGKGALEVFDGALRNRFQERLRLESDLRLALRDDQLFLVYQPIVELTTGTIVGAEALVRWQHPERGLVGPEVFVPIAEQCGLIVPLGGWVLDEAAVQLARWRDQGRSGLRVAVNVSAKQLTGGRLLEQVTAAIQRAGCPAGKLGLEIELTEHTLVEDLEVNLRLLEMLQQLGVRIAIDDFGTGLSSLSYLKRLPVDKLKIDRGFVNGLPDDVGDSAIVNAALSMARALGLRVVAEGVETDAQRKALVALGCELAQGWLFGHPMSAAEFEALLQHQTAARDVVEHAA